MKKIFNKLLMTILTVIFILSLGNFIKIISEYKKNKEAYKEIENIVISKDDMLIENEDEAPINTEKYTRLKEINEDYAFWIYIPNTNVNYPVVMSENNEEYLHKNFKGEGNNGGSIFVDSRNTLEDDNIVIHGHNMKDKSMFGTLSEFLDSEFLKSNNKIYLYFENEVLEYEIFSVYITYGNESPYKFNFVNDSEFYKYIDDSMSNSIQKLNYKDDGKRNIITLSTCTNAGSNKRTIINAKLKSKK